MVAFSRLERPWRALERFANGARAGSSGTAAAGTELPPPSEGEPIPASCIASYLSTPDGRITEEWTSPTDHRLVFRDRADALRNAELDRRISELFAGFPDRAARPELVEWLNSASRWYPRPVVWLAVGLLALIVRRPRGIAVPLVLAGVSKQYAST